MTLAAAGLCLTACQRYQRQPLDPQAHHQAWLDRSPMSEPVQALARRLADLEAGPVVFDPTDGVHVREAQVIALVFNAQLRLARARAGVAAATAEHAGLWSDPEFSIDILRITQSVANPWVITPGLGLTIPISGRLGAERDRADAAMLAELHAIAEAEWSVLAAVRVAWADWSAARLRLQETGDLERRLTAMAQSAAGLAEAGELARAEAALFEIELAQRRNELIGLGEDVRQGELAIRSLMGLSPDAPIELVPAIGIGAQRVPPADSAFDNNPTLARLRQTYEVAEQTLRREVLKQYPDLTLGPLYESDQGQSRIGFFGAIPLPILNANKQGIAEAEAQRSLARAAFETEAERLATQLAATHRRAAALQAQRADVETVLVPIVDRQLAAMHELSEIGEAGSLVILESLLRAHATKLALIALRHDETVAWTEVARLLGSRTLGP